MDMSFLDRERGWAVGLEASFWETEDGGTTWRRPEPPHQPPRKLTEGFTLPSELRHVVRLTPGVAWLQAWVGWKEDQVFLTHDEGQSWFSVGRGPCAGSRFTLSGTAPQR
ncbi:hypothetical protein F0U60_44065 [Archangium minus]|uniref:Exo-alpha-sialidase n=2 Tax=Archangium minus TaxID=83450 RepID=A0ABY9X4K2_9BACT|nr:hypothetical protein F0U60_44065 [Archangium minus]